MIMAARAHWFAEDERATSRPSAGRKSDARASG